MKHRACVGCLALAFAVLSWAPLDAQDRRPLSPQQRNMSAGGLAISPFFEGWWANANGTYTVSFGYFNRNREVTENIPVGPNNFIEPAEFNGTQPTIFSPRRDMGGLHRHHAGGFCGKRRQNGLDDYRQWSDAFSPRKDRSNILCPQSRCDGDGLPTTDTQVPPERARPLGPDVCRRQSC